MKSYVNPVLDGADPFVLLYEDTYYLYSTNADDGFLVYTSCDMAQWTCKGYCLKAEDVMGDWGFWAPEVMLHNGKFYMVYVANEHLGIAVSDSPLGPFRQAEKKWLNEECEIDGHFFVDDDGSVYLYFVRFDEGNVLWCAKMNDDMLSYNASSATYLFRASEPWELMDFSVVEGAFVLKHKGKYYLTYSANHTRSPYYAIGCAVSDSPLGPFTKVPYNPILKMNHEANGPGHHSFTPSRDGGELVCVYHTHFSKDTPFPRVTCIDRAEFVPCPEGGDDRLVIHGPTRTPQKAFNGMEAVTEKVCEGCEMNKTCDILQAANELAEKMKSRIINSPDRIRVSGRSYYVSNDGSDENDGLTKDTPWKTLARVSRADLSYGDGVFFRRGDIFRGYIITSPGVTYGAYGTGEKPRLYGHDRDLADPVLWELYDERAHIWRLKESILDCGTLVFNGGEACCRKLIPSYKRGKFVCRENEDIDFDIVREMHRDLDLFCKYDKRLTGTGDSPDNFPVPLLDENSLAELYLRCDRGNPGEVFSSIEALPRRSMIYVMCNPGVTVDNLCLKYIGIHAVAAGGGCVKDLCVSNCEIGWVGGTVQHYSGTDPNYPRGKRGSVTRYGNGVEIYGGCDGYTVTGCYIYQVYDAGITHQITTMGKTHIMKNITYAENLIENCVYSVEYFLDKEKNDAESMIYNCKIRDNIMRYSGFGWGMQRHNTDTPAHIKGWNYINTAREFSVCGNIFVFAAKRMIHIAADEASSLPLMQGNTYIQSKGAVLGIFGVNGKEGCDDIIFDEDVEEKIKNVLGEKDHTLCFEQAPSNTVAK